MCRLYYRPRVRRWKKGGQLIFEGTPEELIKNNKSYTSESLKEKLIPNKK